MVPKKATYKALLMTLTVMALCVLYDLFAATEFDIMGRVESIGKENNIVILFNERPAEKSYYIINEKTVYGSIEIASVVYNRTGRYKYRAVAQFTLANKMYARHIRAGVDIALVASGKRSDHEYTDREPVRERGYRRGIVSEKDGRQMVLVPEGKFIFGSGSGDRDESPEQTFYLENYYIDVHEVSNDDFLKFVEAKNVNPPLSWEGKKYRDGEGNLPVLVTYYEAESFARWAGKRLPAEEEWEKAARGTGRAGSTSGSQNYIYPWGRDFNPERANCDEFWADDKTGAHLKIRFGRASRGLMPVASFDPEGASPYGSVNMAGNAREWTSSWYMPYQGNRSKQGKEYKRYGKQFKVVRGGAWYSPRYRVRATSREIGGMPNLHTDNLAGFRCVKDADVIDMDKE